MLVSSVERLLVGLVEGSPLVLLFLQVVLQLVLASALVLEPHHRLPRALEPGWSSKVVLVASCSGHSLWGSSRIQKRKDLHSWKSCFASLCELAAWWQFLLTSVLPKERVVQRAWCLRECRMLRSNASEVRRDASASVTRLASSPWSPPPPSIFHLF